MRWWPPARFRRRTRSLCRMSCCTDRVTRVCAVTRAFIACAAAALPLLPAPALATPDPVAQGRDKFVQCAACHGADGRSTVIPQYPKIGGQSGPYLINALKAYRDGRRQGTYAAIMAAVAKPLSDDDIANLAAYIESLDAVQ
jgi:cytochrome c553